MTPSDPNVVYEVVITKMSDRCLVPVGTRGKLKLVNSPLAPNWWYYRIWFRGYSSLDVMDARAADCFRVLSPLELLAAVADD